METLPSLPIPGLSAIPVIGEAFFNRDILTYLLYVLIVVAFFFYRNTNWGLNFIAVGEHPRAAESAGNPGQPLPLDRHGAQRRAGRNRRSLSGAGAAGVFTENMLSGTRLYRLGYGHSGPVHLFGVFGAALLFGAANALQIRLQTIGVEISPHLLAMLPYVITFGGNAGRHRQEQSARGAEQALRQGHALIQRKSRTECSVRGSCILGLPFAWGGKSML